MPLLYVPAYVALGLFLLEELVLIRPVSTIGQSDPVSKRLEWAGMGIPGLGWAVILGTIPLWGDLRLGGVVNGVGLVLCLLGLSLRYWSRRTLGRFFTIGVVKQEAHRVVREGPYRRVRHPAYLGFLIFYLGVPLAVGHWWGLLILTLPAVVIFVLLIKVEDRRMAEELGAEYQAYQQQTARLIPGVW